jgi:DNA-binding Lrp family transcriptional regulator
VSAARPEKTSGGKARLLKIVEGIFEVPFVRIADLPERLGITYPTARSVVERLVAAGILRELEAVPSRTFYAPAVFSIAYDDLDTPSS